MQEEMWDISERSVFDEVIAEKARTFARGVIYLDGDLGTGKTALVQQWLRCVGVKEAVTSPTYQIVNTYQAGGKRFLHADLYRLSEGEELLYLDVREWRDMAEVLFIEWPERGDGYLPAPDVICQLSLSEGVRRMRWQLM